MRSHFVLSEDKRIRLRRALMTCMIGLCFAVAFAMLAISPQTAYAYYNRGEVGVSLGTSTLTLDAGDNVDVTVAFSPAADEQTEGCGLAMCPQNCSPSCFDENGQCTCLGTEYQTYYPSAAVSSGDSSVAMAVCNNGVLTVYGRSAGETDITVRASLRQFTDGEATLHVNVEGSVAEGTVDVSDAAIDMPQEAEPSDDRQDVVEKTVMGRPIRNVRITDGLDACVYLEQMAGIDGETVFWSGDTSYHPDYSVTFVGNTYSADELKSYGENYDPALEITTEAEGTLYQLLDGLDRFVVVDFKQPGTLPSVATVYADAAGALSDDDEVALFAYDENTKSFVRCDESAAVSGGYVTFAVDDGMTYVVSSHDLASEAHSVIANSTDNNGAADNSANVSDSSSSEQVEQANRDQADRGDQNNSGDQTDRSGQISPFVFVLIVAVVIAVVVACIVAVYLHRRTKRKGDTKGNEGNA